MTRPRRDPVKQIVHGDRKAQRNLGRPMWRTGMFWLMMLVICVALAGVALAQSAQSKAQKADRHAVAVLQAQATIAKQQAVIAKQQADLAKAQAAEAKIRADEIRHAFCGLLVPIGKAPISVATSPLGRTLIGQARTGALVIQCPGARP